ncbi:MAG: hypothetical protein ACE5LA_00735 [Dehalococcoidales bacterium]
MPPIFKALASIIVWVLFIFGSVTLLGGFVRVVGASAGILGTPELPTMSAYFGFGVVGLVLSVVVMNLRQMLE